MPKRDWLRPVRHAAARLSDFLNDGSIGARSPESGPITSHPPASATAAPPKPDLLQYGASGTPIISGFVTDMQEYLPELRGRAALRTYEKMRRSDADCAAIAAACKLPIRAAEFKVVPGIKENEPDFAYAKTIAEDVQDMLFGGLESTDARGNVTSQSFESIIENALLCMDYGVSASEDMWVIDGDRVRLRKISSRLPLTFYQFPVEEDGETLQALIQWGYRGDKWVTATVPASKLTLFTYRKEGANFYGRSMFREAYQHWYVKNALYRIDSIACERNGMGVPVISGEGAMSEEDKVTGGEFLQNLSVNENTGLLLPGGWTLELKGVTGQAHDMLPSIQHHSEMICRSALAMFMSLGTSQTGSRALGNVMVDFFQLSEEATARFICETIRETSIRRYCDFNYAPAKKSGKVPYPRLVIPNIAVINPLDIMQAMKDVADSKIDFLQPDDETENWLRKKIGMPLKAAGGGRTRFSPVSVRVMDDEAGSPQDIEDGKGKPAPAAKAPAPGLKPAVKKKLTDSQQLRELEGRRKWHGLDISIENETGSTRSGTAVDGTAWSVEMKHPYGYIRRTEGVDGDHVDCFMGPDPDSEFVHVVHQVEPSTGNYDEDKCMLDFPSADAAKEAYLANYDRPDFFHSMTTLPVDAFIEKVKATYAAPSKITAKESLEPTRELMPHEKKHDFAGHCQRADKTQTAIRRILAGASPGLQREAARRASFHPPDQLGALSLPFDKGLQARITRALEIAFQYGFRQVYAERYRGTKRPTSQKPIRAMLSNVPSAEQDKPSLIAQAAVADLQNAITTRAKAAHIDQFKKGVHDASDLSDAIEDALREMSDGYLDRIAMEAARSGVVGGRFEAFKELSGEIASYARSEAMDQNTCEECAAGDGVEWATLDEVDWSPGDDCQGADACRGQLMPIFEDEGTVETEGSSDDE